MKKIFKIAYINLKKKLNKKRDYPINFKIVKKINFENLPNNTHIKKKKRGKSETFYMFACFLHICTTLEYHSNPPFGDIDNYQFLIYLISALLL